jgi:hypothetical protein
MLQYGILMNTVYYDAVYSSSHLLMRSLQVSPRSMLLYGVLMNTVYYDTVYSSSNLLMRSLQVSP